MPTTLQFVSPRVDTPVVRTGLVFNLQKYSLHDGPGIRTTVFLKGCPLCCPWCHNPEGISRACEVVLVEARCLFCGECRRVCNFSASMSGEDPLPAHPDPCNLCGACVEACPAGARQMIGREMTVAEVMDVVLKDRLFYEESAGGVTFSGGEPLLQPAFLKDLLEDCRDRGIHTAVDTCGFACTDHLLAVGRLTDLFLYDLKLMDDTRHRKYCGVSNQPILENLKALDQIHQNIWLRVPIIPGVNDDEENLSAIARFAVTISGIHQVNLLPYHDTAAQKSRRLNQVSGRIQVPPPSAAELARAAGIFRSAGLTVNPGG